MIYTLYLVDDNSNITETISLDVINSFGEDYSSNIAQNTVENGYVISDSISINNPKFSIGGVITDSKFRVKGQLVVFNGNTFVKSQGDNRDQFQTISDDDYAEKVKARLIKLWENKEIFGILESTDINNLQGSKVRNIFPCVLSSLGFSKSDAASAIYPTMSIERIRYATVTIGKVTNPVAELSRKYEADRLEQSKTTNVGTGVKSEDKASDHKADAKALLGNLVGEAPKKASELKLSTESLIKQAYANAIEGVKVTKLEGAARVARIHELAEQQFNLSVSRGEALESNPKFVRRNF
jgi:hypothetical protein